MQPGQRVGKYVLGERIARGGMAEVWAADVEGPGGFVKPVALKFILESFAGDPELERLFLNEARVAAQLQHANLVAVFDFDKVSGDGGGAPDRYYIAMERIDGHDLRRVMRAAAERGRRIAPALSLYVAGEVLKGLRHAHERRDDRGGRGLLGLVHRDVSPHNVLVGFDGDVKLSDFGIAKAMAAAHSLGTDAGTVRGKLAYASPEQLRSAAIDHRSDQFSLGVVLWELLAARRLFDGADAAGIVAQVLRGEVPPLERSAAVDPAVEAIARRMLSPAPEARFASTAAALAAVRGAPGYAGDAAGIVELMRELFAPAGAGAPLPPTLELDGKGAPPASLATAPTRSIGVGRLDGAPAAGASAALAPVADAFAGTAVAVPGAPPPAAGSAGAMATGSAELSFFKRATEGSGSSAYATTLSSDVADASRAPARGRLPRAIGLGALAAAVTLGGLALAFRWPPLLAITGDDPPSGAAGAPASAAGAAAPAGRSPAAPPGVATARDPAPSAAAADAAIVADASAATAALPGLPFAAPSGAAVAGTGGAGEPSLPPSPSSVAAPAPAGAGGTRERSAANGAPLLE